MILSILFVVINMVCFYQGIRNKWPMWLILLNLFAALFNVYMVIGHLAS